MGLNLIKIDNSKKAAIAKGKWKNPGAKFYDTLMDSMWCEGDIPTDAKEIDEKIKDDKYYYYDRFLKEAYLVAPVKDIKNSPYGRTPFARSGCKYPHHVVKGDKLVVSIPGLRSAYITARNQGCFNPDASKRPEYSRELVAHLNRHFKELKLKPVWHHGEFYLMEESAIQIEQNFHDINSYIMEKTGIDLFDDIEPFEEKYKDNLKFSFRLGINKENGHLIRVTFDFNKDDILAIGSHDDTNPVSDDEEEEIKKHITKTGYPDFISVGTVKAITDLDTGEKLNTVNMIGVMSGNQQFANKPLKEREKVKETGGIMGGGTRFTVGEKEKLNKRGWGGTYKTTVAPKSASDLSTKHGGKLLSGKELLPYGRGYKANHRNLFESAMSNEAIVLTSETSKEIGETPEKFYEWMHENISYDDTDNGWKLRTPSEVYMDRKGNSHDQALFEAFHFHSNNIVNGQLFFVKHRNNNPIEGTAHTITWYRTAKKKAKLSDDWKGPFKEENAAQGPYKFWWFENAWDKHAGINGINGPYASIDELKQAIIDVCRRENESNPHKYDGIIFGKFSNHRCGMSLSEYVNSWKLTDSYSFEDTDKYFRVTYNGIGIYEAMRQHMSAEQWKDLLKSSKFTWLPKPKEYPSDCKSYFTKEGMDKFNELVMPIATGCLGNNIKVEKFTDVKDIIYRDQYQVITKSTNELIKESLDWIDRFVNDSEFREAVEITEKSHGALKYDYRIGIDVNTGRQVAIQFILDPKSLTTAGNRMYYTNAYLDTHPEYDKMVNKIYGKVFELRKSGKTEEANQLQKKLDDKVDRVIQPSMNKGLEFLKKNIRKIGNIDHITDDQLVDKIFLRNGQSLNSVEMIPSFDKRFGKFLDHLGDYLRSTKDDTIYNYYMAPPSNYKGNKWGFIDIRKMFDNLEIQKLFVKWCKSNNISGEKYEVGKLGGKGKYKTTKLTWDMHYDMHKFGETPAVRGFNKRDVAMADDTAYHGNNKPKYTSSGLISEAYTLKNLPDKMYFGTPNKITGKTISARSPRGLFMTPYIGIASMFIIDISKELDVYMNDILRKNHRELINHSCNIEYDEWNLDSKDLTKPLAKTHMSHNIPEFNEVKDGTATGYIYEVDVSKIKNQLQTYVTDDPDRELIYKGDDKLPITGVIQHTINWTLKYKSNGQKGTFETRVIKESVDEPEDQIDTEEQSKKDEPFVPIYGIIKSYSSSEFRNDGTKKSASEMGSVKFDKIIHKVTRGDNYSHALVSFDDSLTEMYSYEDEGFCIDNIMTKESWMSTKSIYICVMFVRESDRNRMKAYVNELKEHPEETRYAMGNLLKAYIATPTKIDKRFVCSSFTGFIMSCSNPKNLRRDYSRMRPDDITLLPRAFYVANVRDREEFKERRQEIKDRVNAIYDEYKEDINDYNNHLPRIMLQDRVDKYKTIDRIFDWIINKLA